MIYTILFEADKHWGALRPREQYQSSYIIKRIMADIKIDLFVSLGDFFDTKLLLNSKASVYALRDMQEKVDICQRKKVKMRAIRGTLSHDYDQLHAFDKLVGDTFQFFDHTTIEETLPKMTILYCPDESMNWETYADHYFSEIASTHIHMACCHGDFDTIIPTIARDIKDESTGLVYRYSDLHRHVNGPIVSGHWHEYTQKDHLFYVGSADRWAFGEDEAKGYAIVRYNTETEEYQFIRVPNFLAPAYKVYDVYTSLYKDAEAYHLLEDTVDALLAEDETCRIKIHVHVNEIYGDTEAQLLHLRYHFGSHKRVVIQSENLIRQKAKALKKQETKDMAELYGFVRKEKSIPRAVHRWIRTFKNKDYPLEQIEEIFKPELELLERR